MNDFFTIDLFHYLFTTYLVDRIGFLCLVHPLWKSAVEELRLPKTSLLKFLTESESLVTYALNQNIRVTTKSLIPYANEIGVPPKVFFKEPFEFVTFDFVCNYIYQQRGKNVIHLMEKLLSFPDTITIIRKTEPWFKLVYVLLFAGDDVVFEWFVNNIQRIFQVELNFHHLLNMYPISIRKYYTNKIKHRCEFDQKLDERIIRTLIRFPELRGLDFHEALFDHYFVMNLDQIKTLVEHHQEFPVNFFSKYFFRVGIIEEYQTNEFLVALQKRDFVMLKQSVADFCALVPSFEMGMIQNDYFLGYCLAKQWEEGVEFFGKETIKGNSVDIAVYGTQIKPLREDFWKFIKSHFSVDVQNVVLEFFLFNTELDEKMIERINDSPNIKERLKLKWMWLSYDSILRLLNVDQSFLINSISGEFYQLFLLIDKSVEDPQIKVECKILVIYFGGLINPLLNNYNLVILTQNCDIATTCVNLLLDEIIDFQLKHQFQYESIRTLLCFLNPAEKSIPVLKIFKIYSNSKYLPLLIPYLKIQQQDIRMFSEILNRESLELLWNYFDYKFNDELISMIFDYRCLTNEVIGWFKEKKILLPQNVKVWENLMMFYMTENKLDLFFQEFHQELRQLEQPLLKEVGRELEIEISPQMLICMKESGFVSHESLISLNFLNYTLAFSYLND